MTNAMDFNKIRKKRRRAQLLKRMGALLGIVLILMVILSLNEMLVQEGILTRMRDFFGGLGGSGYPIAAPGGVLREVMAVEGDVGVLNDTNLYLYNNRGKELLNLQRMNDQTIALTAGGRILTYELGGTKYRIHTRQSLLLEKENDHAITAMALGERGDYALVSSSKQYTAQVTVFTPRFEMAFQWSSNEMVTGVALHPKGGKMVASGVGALEGVLRSAVYFFSFDSDKELAKVEYPDQLILWIAYLDDNHIGVLTDTHYYVLDGEGNQLTEFSFDGENPTALQCHKGDVLLLCENAEARSYTLLLVDARGKELGNLQLEQKVRDMQVGGDGVYLLTDQEIVRLDKTLSPNGAKPVSGVNRILLANEVLYAFTSEEIQALDSFGTAQATAPSPAR
ncbi:MAG TPA: hypothetical protein GX499_09620 [Clostridiales bacterium]|nr:hypothetical protein [Clostridiales bacterium]